MVTFSICGLCKNNTGDKRHFSCPAFPNGASLEDMYRYTNEECGHGYSFEPKDAYKNMCDKEFMEKFSKK